jgi:hypothetical protein
LLNLSFTRFDPERISPAKPASSLPADMVVADHVAPELGRFAIALTLMTNDEIAFL